MYGFVALVIFHELRFVCSNNNTTIPTANYSSTLSLTSPTENTKPYHITSSAVTSQSIEENAINQSTESPTHSYIAMYAGIGGGVGALAVIAGVIVLLGWYSKHKMSRNRVDISSEHSDCPSWRHVNVKHPLSSRITERTENSSSHRYDI